MRKAGAEPAIIVFGYNEHRIPQAAWFPEAEAALATRAARLMGLRVLRIENDAHRELAARLRQGQVYAADRTFAPAVLREVFDTLCELAGPVGAASKVEITASKDKAASRPASWEAIAVGNLVIAQESLKTAGGRRSSWRSRKTSWCYAGATMPGSHACAGAAWMSHCCPR